MRQATLTFTSSSSASSVSTTVNISNVSSVASDPLPVTVLTHVPVSIIDSGSSGAVNLSSVTSLPLSPAVTINLSQLDPEQDTTGTTSRIKYQPNNPETVIPPQQLNGRMLRFQSQWFKDFPWLHYQEDVGGVLCFTCSEANSRGLMSLDKYGESAFITDGFRNWKKGREKFSIHALSKTHALAHHNITFQAMQPSVAVQLKSQLASDQAQARQALLKIVSSIRMIAMQGLALRGKENSEGNVMSLLKLRATDDKDLHSWLQRKTTYTCGEIQN